MNYTAKFRRFPGRVINQKQIHCNTCCTRPRSCGFLMRRPRGNMKSFSLLSVSSLVNISVDCNNKTEAAKRSVETFWHPSVLSLPSPPARNSRELLLSNWTDRLYNVSDWLFLGFAFSRASRSRIFATYVIGSTSFPRSTERRGETACERACHLSWEG